MDTSSLVVDKAQQLAAAGRHAEVVSYLGARKGTELADSPSLALLYGTAQARLGRHEEGLRWVDLALDQAHKRDEQAVERHALNARGAIALVSGRIDEAADYFTRALMAASRDGDLATTARCSNNLGSSATCGGGTPRRSGPGRLRSRRSTGPVCDRASPSAATTWRSRIVSRGPSTARWPRPTRLSRQPRRPGIARCGRKRSGDARRSAWSWASWSSLGASWTGWRKSATGWSI